MSLKGVAKKVKDVHEVWDNVPLKLFLWIHEAFDLQGSKKVGCRVQVGRQKRKTKLVKPTETKWEDLMFFLPSEEDEVRIEVWDEHMLGDVFLGELELAPVKMMQIDEPTMLERDLLDQPGKKRKSKVLLQATFSSAPLSTYADCWKIESFLLSQQFNRNQASCR